jgi:hypothetical protein
LVLELLVYFPRPVLPRTERLDRTVLALDQVVQILLTPLVVAVVVDSPVLLKRD